MEIEVIKGQAQNEVEVKTAKDFVALVASGVPESKAAEQVGQPLAALKSSQVVREWLEKVLPFYINDPNNRRKTVIAAMTRVLATGEDKDAVAAARVLIKDPQIGFGNQAPTVSIKISDDIRKTEVGVMWPDDNDEQEETE